MDPSLIGDVLEDPHASPPPHRGQSRPASVLRRYPCARYPDWAYGFGQSPYGGRTAGVLWSAELHDVDVDPAYLLPEALRCRWYTLLEPKWRPVPQRTWGWSRGW